MNTALRVPTLAGKLATPRSIALFRTTLVAPRTFSNTASAMSFSNADTGSKPADPYKAENKNDPELKEKVDDLVNFIETCKFGMMTTRIESSGLLVSRCMAVAAKEGGGLDLLFHTNTESGKTDDLKSDPKINMAFLDGQGQWASISGTADIVTDRDMVRKYYSPTLKAWLGDLGDGKHDGGPEDPRIGVIKITAQTATYAISEGNFVSRQFQVAKGTVTGQAPNVNKLREITEEELEQCKWPISSHHAFPKNQSSKLCGRLLTRATSLYRAQGE
ncbi:MAG: hypothetical protein LQ344_002204 [Seirophora lacunosa]|nr:MAG: hypothetical protein LQ344_002204 [Seirophora lacunosa]